MQVYRATGCCRVFVARDIGMSTRFLRRGRHEHGRVVDATLFIDLRFLPHTNSRCAVYKKSGAVRKGPVSQKTSAVLWCSGLFFHGGAFVPAGRIVTDSAVDILGSFPATPQGDYYAFLITGSFGRRTDVYNVSPLDSNKTTVRDLGWVAAVLHETSRTKYFEKAR